MISKEIIKKIRQIQIFTKKSVTSLFSGEYESAFKGKGIEFEEVREYYPGDDVRSIDWNVTARTGIPHIKRYREERELTVLFVVDFSASGLLKYGQKTRNEFAAELVTVLSFAANINNDKTGLLVFTDQTELFIPPEKGLRHVLRMTRELLVFRPESKKTSISNALNYVMKVAERRSVIFLISDFYDSDWSGTVKKISLKHDLVNIMVRDKRELELPNAGLIDIIDPESGKRTIIDSSSSRIRNAFRKNAEVLMNKIRNETISNGADFLCLTAQSDWIFELGKFFRRREGLKA